MWKNKRALVEWLSLIVGIVFTAVAFPLFFVPNDIAPGGITGVATLIASLTGLPIGFLSILLNAPLFLVSWKRLGRMFAIKSLIGVFGVSFVIDLFPFGAMTHDPILAAVFGGVVMGVGLGLVIRAGATTGGTDMAATLIHERFPFISVGALLLSLDFCVVIASGFVFDLQAALYALIAIFISTQVMDRVIEGFESAKAFFVFSRHSEEISTTVMTQLERGATLLHAQGAFTKAESDVLLCVVMRTQVPKFKTIVTDIDPTAFMMVTDVREALGEGFTRPSDEQQAANQK